MEKNLFSREECLNLINRVESNDRWRRLDDKIYHYQISECHLNESEEFRVRYYCKKHLNIELNKIDTAIFKYKEGDYILRHVDRFTDVNTKHHTNMLYNINMRLNDDYEGGEFYLKGNPFIQDVGTVYHYKSNDIHEVKPVTAGVRYTILFYIRESYIKRDTSMI